jgi:predicted nucleic acid-binding protein
LAQRGRLPGRGINYTRGKFFVDTNLLVYAYDSSAGKKWRTSLEILSLLWTHRTGVLSTQVLQELFVSLTQEVRNPIPSKAARKIIADFLHWPLVVNDGKHILNAIDIQMKYHFSFLDSLILQAAVVSKSEFLLSEDFQDRQVIESLTIVNPFLE